MAYVKHIKDSWLLSHYRAARAYADLGEDQIGELVMSTYKLVDGKWVETSSAQSNATWTNYFNVFDSIPYWQKEMGHREIVTDAHTRYGYLPVQLSSIDRFGEMDIFRFNF